MFTFYFIYKKINNMKNITLSIITLCFLIFATINTNAQNRKIEGTITSAENGKAISGITISVKGSPEITNTDKNGKYRLFVSDTLKNIEFHDFPTMAIKNRADVSKDIINLILIEKELTIYDIPLDMLVELKIDNIEVITASLKLQNIDFAPSNITVITHEMIENRAYQSLIDICQDIPGFDFMIFNDGGGEYPTFNMNRGLGTIGNTKILIMVDGIIQNNISYNWSLLWTYENLLVDIERIEIIEGPGSSMYGAQAFTGVIHFITKKNYEGVMVKPFYGSNFTRGIDVLLGKNFNNNVNLSLAFHKYNTNGDGGLRYDPANYFHNNLYPDTILADYNSEGNYITNQPNPIGGEPIPDGFQNWHNSISMRAKLNFKNTETGVFFWEDKKGIGSYLTAYEYKITDDKARTASRGYHVYMNNETNINNKLSMHTYLVFRSTNILPQTGFLYHYKFPSLVKSYAAYAYQAYIEERLSYILTKNTDFLAGIKGMTSLKSPRIVSLNDTPNNMTETQSAWNEASAGNGLNIKETNPLFVVHEFATYFIWNTQWTPKIATSLGVRYDNSSEYGEILNPRLSLIYKPEKYIGIKLLYGSAFKQPSIFELNSEFRGNPNLDPEKISTYEIELFSSLFHNRVKLKTNIFYSEITDFIGKVPDATMPSGERYENKDKFFVSGLSFELNYKILTNLTLYANYMYLQGKESDATEWSQIDRTAQHKINAGLNVSFFQKKLNVNCRLNYVGKRKAQSTNTWLQTYEAGFAPSYKKINFVISYKALKYFEPQLIIENMLNEQYYGIGRESGNGFVDDYNYQTNVNPSGFIPAYHPQQGRTILFNLKFAINK